MDRLPIELLEAVFDFCDFASLKAFRLVSRHYSEAATPAVFRHVYTALFPDCLEKFVALTRSPGLSRHVHKLTFFSEVLPDLTWYKWESCIVSQTSRVRLNQLRTLRGQSLLDFFMAGSGIKEGRDLYSLSESHRRKAFERYLQLRKSQFVWCEDSVRQCFKECFSSLPNIVDAEIWPCRPYQHHSRLNILPVWRRLLDQTLIGPDDWWPEGSCLEDPEFTPSSRLCKQAFSCLLEAIGFRASFASTSRQLTSLRAKASHKSPLWIHDRTRPALLTNISAAFKHLQSLQLWLPEPLGHTTATDALTADGTPLAVAELNELLRNAPQLRWLELKVLFSSASPVSHSPGMLLELPRSLVHLAIFGEGSRCHHLPVMLERLGPQLQSLELRDIGVHDLRELLRQIRTTFTLQRIYLECVDHSCLACDKAPLLFSVGSSFPREFERAVTAYVLRQSDQVPDVPSGCQIKSEDSGSDSDAGDPVQL